MEHLVDSVVRGEVMEKELVIENGNVYDVITYENRLQDKVFISSDTILEIQGKNQAGVNETITVAVIFRNYNGDILNVNYPVRVTIDGQNNDQSLDLVLENGKAEFDLSSQYQETFILQAEITDPTVSYTPIGMVVNFQ
jgi:hypothetical protein